MNYIECNAKYKRRLGRDKDPRLTSDINHITLWLKKNTWKFLTIPGLRTMTNLIYPKSTISHFNKNGAVSFTIDDGFCGIDNKVSVKR